MTSLVSTRHSAARMAQRGIRARDAELIALIGTEVADGYLVRSKDVQVAEREIKHLLARIRRLKGKRLITAEGTIITAYHATHRQQRGLLRRVRESDLWETEFEPRRD